MHVVYLVRERVGSGMRSRMHTTVELLQSSTSVELDAFPNRESRVQAGAEQGSGGRRQQPCLACQLESRIQFNVSINLDRSAWVVGCA